MASKMKRTKKQRTHKTSPNTAGPARRKAQEERAAHNKTLTRTPWEKAKLKRYHSPDRKNKRANYNRRAVKA